MAPPVAIIRRSRQANHPVLSAAARNERPRERIAPQRAPEQPRRGDTPARPARRQVYQSLAIAQIRSVMRDFWRFGKGEHDPLRAQPRGKSLVWEERTNIAKPMPEAFGSIYHLEPIDNPDESRMRALMGVPQ